MDNKHSDKEKAEKTCKAMLEIYDSNKFSNLVKSESPDFRNDKVFIEVRRIILSEIAEFKALLKDYDSKNIDEIPNERLLKLGFDKNKIQKTSLHGFSLRSDKVGSIELIKNKQNEFLVAGAILKFNDEDCRIEISNNIFYGLKEKLDKLNDHYDKGNENDVIFLIDDFTEYVPFSFANSILDLLINKIKKENLLSKYNVIFDYVYLFFIDSFIALNLKTFEYDFKKIDQQIWDEIKTKI